MKRRLHWAIIALIVIAIIMIVLAIIFPVFGRAREKARLPSRAGAPPPLQAEAGPAGAGPGGAPAGAPAQAVIDRKIITTGSMRIEVDNLDQALRTLGELVSKHGGFFSDRTVTTERSWRDARVEIRVPADRFEALHQGAQGLGEVREDRQEGEDVTRQWQDLEARLRIRKAEERALLKLLQRQGSIQALLQVEKQLWDVREQIERAEGELRYLRDRVTLATLTVYLNERTPAGVGKVGPWNLGYHLTNALVALVEIVRALLIAFIYIIIAGIVLWLPALLVLLWVRKRRRNLRSP